MENVRVDGLPHEEILVNAKRLIETTNTQDSLLVIQIKGCSEGTIQANAVSTLKPLHLPNVSKEVQKTIHNVIEILAKQDYLAALVVAAAVQQKVGTE